MTVTTLGSESSLDGRVRGLDESGNNLSLSVPSTTAGVPLQAYGSIDLIEPAGKGGQNEDMMSKKKECV